MPDLLALRLAGERVVVREGDGAARLDHGRTHDARGEVGDGGEAAVAEEEAVDVDAGTREAAARAQLARVGEAEVVTCLVVDVLR